MQICFSSNFQGMDQEEAQKQYMEILRSWPGYGSTLFDVEVRNAILSAQMSTEIPRLLISLYTVSVGGLQGGRRGEGDLSVRLI